MSESTTQTEIPLTLVMVRHGQAGGPSIDDVVGPPLTRLGRQQAERVAERLSREKFQHVYTSDLARAYDTAQEILKYHKNTAYTVTADLREVAHHHFVSEMRPLKPSARKNIKLEREAMDRFIMQLTRTHGAGERILVVCHGNIMRTLVPLFGHRDPRKCVLIEYNNTCVTIADLWLSTGEAVLKLANCVKHLTPGLVT